MVCSISVGAADHRVKLACGGTGGQVHAELVQQRGVPLGRAGRPRWASVRCRRGTGRRLSGTLGGGLQGLRGDPGGAQHLAGGGFGVEHEGQEKVLGIDVGRAEGAGHLVGIQQGALGRWRQGGSGFEVPRP